MNLAQRFMLTAELSEKMFDYVGAKPYLYIAGISIAQRDVFETSTKITPMRCVGESQSRIDDLPSEHLISSDFVTRCVRASLRAGDLASVVRLFNHIETFELRLRGKRSNFMVLSTLKSESIPCLTWCNEQGYRIDTKVFTTACGVCSIGIVSWLLSVRKFDVSEGAYLEAAKFGRVEMLRFLRERSPDDYSSIVISKAAFYRQLETVKFLIEQGTLMDASACCFAALGGSIEILQHLRSQGCPWDERTCWMATIARSLPILKWARDNGCPWDKLVFVLSGNNRVPDIHQYAVANGCPQV